MARLVALKALSPQADEAAVARFYDTAKFAAQLHHANIASIYDVSSAGGTHYCTMEYIEGRSVGDLLGARQKIPTSDAIRVAISVAEALRFANAKGVPGWSLSPGHVFITTRNEVKLVPPTFVPAGATVLSDGYVLAAVGVLLYAMLTGGRVPDLEAALESGSPLPAQLPRLKSVALGMRNDIAQVVDRLLGVAGDPYANAEAGIAGLRQLVVAQDELETRTRNATDRARERVKRSRTGVYVLAVGLPAVLLLIIGVLVFGRAAKQNTIEQEFAAAHKAALANLDAAKAAMTQFYKDPSQALADEALAQLQKARAAYAAFYASYPMHTKGTTASLNIENVDKNINSFQEDVPQFLRRRAGRSRVQEVDNAFERDVADKLQHGGQIDIAAWRARYHALLKEFPNSPQTQQEIARTLAGLDAKVQAVQMKVETNQLDIDFNNKYRPELRYKEALAAWEAYRDKYQKIEKFRNEALQIYQQKTTVIERDAREQYTKIITRAERLAGEKNYAEARKLYQQIIDKFGIPSLVDSARKKLAELPKG